MKFPFNYIYLTIFCLLILKDATSQSSRTLKPLDMPNKIIHRDFDNLNYPQTLTIVGFLFPIEGDFKYPYDTMQYRTLESHASYLESTEFQHPLYFPFTTKFDTVECHCRILDSYTTTVYEKGVKKMIPKSAKVYIMENNQKIIAVYVINPKWQEKLDLAASLYKFIDIKITDLVPLRGEYQVGIGEYLNYISFVSNNYLFKDVLLNPYYIICDE